MIYVLGSIRNNVTLELERFPKNGEEVIADTCSAVLGGKGASQAVAISRLSRRDDCEKTRVKLIGRVGNDAVGLSLVEKLNSLGVDTEFVHKTNRSTGSAIKYVTEKSHRTVIYNGANSGISKTDIDEALDNATSGDTLLCQLEVPMYIVMYALSKAHTIGMTTIVNPAPATKLPEDFYYNVDVLVTNRTGVQVITDIEPKDFRAQMDAVRYFHRHGVQYAVITLGANGAAISDGAFVASHVHAPKVDVVDKTGGGDAFIGALALSYPHVGMYSFEEACGFAAKAASLTVARAGGVEEIPAISEIVNLYNREIK